MPVPGLAIRLPAPGSLGGLALLALAAVAVAGGRDAYRKNPTCPWCSAQISDPEEHKKHVKACEKKVRAGQTSMFGQQAMPGLFDRENPGKFFTFHHAGGTSDVHPLGGTWPDRDGGTYGLGADYEPLFTVAGKEHAGKLIERLSGAGHHELAQELRYARDHAPEPRQQARRRLGLDRAVEREYQRNLTIHKPRWAHGWTRANLIGLMEYADKPITLLGEGNWWDHLKPELVSEYRDHYLPKRRSYGLMPSRRERRHRVERRKRSA